MFVGQVIGNVWASVKWPQINGLKLLTVRPYHLVDLVDEAVALDSELTDNGAPCHDLVVCADVLGAGVGEDVVVAYGHAARVALHESLGPDELPGVPVDAAVVAIVDHLEVSRRALEGAAARCDAQED